MMNKLDRKTKKEIKEKYRERTAAAFSMFDPITGLPYAVVPVPGSAEYMEFIQENGSELEKSIAELVDEDD